MATLEQRIEQIQTTIGATAGASPEVQAAAIAAIVPPPTGEGINRLWMMLVAGFLVLLLVALAGVVISSSTRKTPMSP